VFRPIDPVEPNTMALFVTLPRRKHGVSDSRPRLMLITQLGGHKLPRSPAVVLAGDGCRACLAPAIQRILYSAAYPAVSASWGGAKGQVIHCKYSPARAE
jgi:hypothetical protein